MSSKARIATVRGVMGAIPRGCGTGLSAEGAERTHEGDHHCRDAGLRLRPAATAPAAPTLDEHQQQVVDHAGGPLLVLAGPGTGKTTTLVEAIVGAGRGRRPPRPGAGAHVLPQGRRAACATGSRRGWAAPWRRR